MIDSHTHIFEPEFDEDRREVLERACSAGVERSEERRVGKEC